MGKLKNRSLQRGEAALFAARTALRREEFIAKQEAKAALKKWYETGYIRAEYEIPKMQIESNLKVVASIPGWQDKKGLRNGYIMITTLFDGTPRPIFLELNYRYKPTGGLTYRQLHQQVRQTLQLEPKVSLRMCSYRPWYRHAQTSSPVPEHLALPANDTQCRDLLGTTVLCYLYV